MPLKYQRWDVNQRLDAGDINAGSAYAYSNLALALKGFLAPSTGIVRGGEVTPVAGSRYVTVGALAAVAPSDLVIVEAPVSLLVQPGGSQPRIDLVIVSYGQTNTDQAQRYSINPASGTVAQVPVMTTRTVSATVSIVQGTAAASPVAPATPTNALALATIYVDPGSDPITIDKIARVEASRFDAIRTIGSSNSTGEVLIPWTAPSSLALAVPTGFCVLVLAQATIRPITSGVSATEFSPHLGVFLDVHDPATPGVALTWAVVPMWAGKLQAGGFGCPVATIGASAVLVPPNVPNALRIRLGRASGDPSWINWASADVQQWSVMAVVL